MPVLRDYVIVFLLSLVPGLEVKGAIPRGIAMGIDPWVTFGLACASALLICPTILILLKPVIEKLKKVKRLQKFGEALEGVFKNKAEKADGKDRTFRNNLVLFLFVAFPAPLTGVWTGSAIAAFSKQKYRYSIIPIFLGCIVQGLIFTLIFTLTPEGIREELADYITYGALGLMLISVSVILVQLYMRYKKGKARPAEELTENGTENNDDTSD